MLKYTLLSGKKMATEFGTVEIDENGVVKGLSTEQEKKFKDIPGFEFEEAKKAEPKKEEPKKEEPKPTTTRKTTTRRSTATKEENK